jgi:hypothetical protein
VLLLGAAGQPFPVGGTVGLLPRQRAGGLGHGQAVADLGQLAAAQQPPRASRPLNLSFRRGGSFDFRDHALPSRGLTLTQLSWRISDHLPLWAAFGTDPADRAGL